MSLCKHLVKLFPLGEEIWPEIPAYLARQQSDIECVSFFDFIIYCLYDHQSGNWNGDEEETKKANTVAIERGGQVVSHHRWDDGIVVEFITEADRSATRIILHKACQGS